MSKLPNPAANGGVPQGGVLLGARRLQLDLDRIHHEKLKILADVNNASIHEAASIILSRAIDQGFAQLQASKFIAMCSAWITWSHAILPPMP